MIAMALARTTDSQASVRLLAAAVFASAALAAAQLVRAESASDAYLATGTVECTSHADLVGVWVSAPYGDAGWADRRPEPGYSGRTRFARWIPHGGPYMVNVGCGGTPQAWAVSASSGPLGRPEVDLLCNDRQPALGNLARWLPFLGSDENGPEYGRCDRR